MEAFIKKEADEKAKEIKLKADEEYELEKSNLVHQETSSIDSLFEEKLKKSKLAQQINKSTIANKSRLQVLAEKETLLNDIYSKAEDSLKKIVTEEKEYKEILIKLIEETAYTLLEPAVFIKVCERDVKLIESILPDVKEAMEKNLSDKTPEIIIRDDSFLDADKVIGGIIACNKTTKIEVDNTLTERLKLLSTTALPSVRLELFGPSKTRKFFE